MQTLSDWLKRGEKKPKKRKRMNSASPKMKAKLRIYSKKKKAFLAEHRLCQAYDVILSWAHNNYDTSALAMGTWLSVQVPGMRPRATEIHHRLKPRSKYLNDESTWLAVCRWSHDWIENNKSTARKLGLLE